jgi:hypothetical protein
MMRRLWNDIHLALLAQVRARFLHVYAFTTLFVIAILRWAVPTDELRTFLVPFFLFGEPGMLGVSLAAAYRYLEEIEGSGSALRVTPLQPGEHVAALSLTTAGVGAIFGAAVFAGVFGPDVRALALLPPLFLQGILSAVLGFALSLRYADFMRFILGVIPWVALYQAPLLYGFGVVPAGAVAWNPTLPALLAYRELAEGTARLGTYALWCALLAAFAALALWGVTRLYERALARPSAATP